MVHVSLYKEHKEHARCLKEHVRHHKEHILRRKENVRQWANVESVTPTKASSEASGADEQSRCFKPVLSWSKFNYFLKNK